MVLGVIGEAPQGVSCAKCEAFCSQIGHKNGLNIEDILPAIHLIQFFYYFTHETTSGVCTKTDLLQITPKEY